jgi:hypothetical protein
MVNAANLEPEGAIRLRIDLLSGEGRELGDKNIYRIIDIKPKQTLRKLHDSIFSAFDRFDWHLHDFWFGSDQPWVYDARPAKGIKRYGVPDELETFPGDFPCIDSSKVRMLSLNLKSGDVFYYNFDFGDDWWHRITVLALDVPLHEAVRYPLLVEKIGESPAQYRCWDED